MLEASHFMHLDIFAEVERYTSTRLSPARSGKQANGACPYDDCSADENGFMVWPELTDRGRHYHCRVCKRAGDIVKLVQDIKGWEFKRACEELGIDLAGKKGTQYTPRKRTKRAIVGAIWQQKELAFLQWLYPAMVSGLGKARARAYLDQRAIPLEIAQQYGLGYIPPFADMVPSELGVVKATINQEEIELTQEEKIRLLKRWEDRIIFPLQSSDGQGFIGRALKFWQPGMSEQEHKRFIDEHNSPIQAYNKDVAEGNKELPKDKQKRPKPLLERYLKTYPAGYFHTESLEKCEHITCTEGPFDALALLAGGIVDALATCGTSLDAAAIPVRICDATLAYDGDDKGKEAASRVYKVLRHVGITPKVCTPLDDGKGKDWSERYRLQGIEGLAPLLQSEPPAAEDDDFKCSICHSDLSLDSDCQVDENGIAFCSLHWQALQSNIVKSSPSSQEQFMSTVQAVASRLESSTGVSWQVLPVDQAETQPDTTGHDQHQSSQVKRLPMPTWLQPQSKDYVGYERRKAFLDGFSDVRGNKWTGHQYYHSLLINKGEELGYPDMTSLYAVPETRGVIGYEAWLALARSDATGILVEMVVRAAEQMQRSKAS